MMKMHNKPEMNDISVKDLHPYPLIVTFNAGEPGGAL